MLFNIYVYILDNTLPIIFIYATLSLFKMTSAILCAQFYMPEKQICFSDNFIISPYAVSGQHDLLQEFYSCV